MVDLSGFHGDLAKTHGYELTMDLCDAIDDIIAAYPSRQLKVTGAPQYKQAPILASKINLLDMIWQKDKSYKVMNQAII